MQVILKVVAGPHEGLVFQFDRHDTFLVGRSQYAHFRLPSKDKYFSRIHFMMEVNPPYCRLVDLGSHNGTFLNGQRVLMADVHHGDQIRAGRTVMQLTVAQEAGEAPSVELPPGQWSQPTPAAATPACPPGYVCVDELGQGEQGHVYLARWQRDETLVALKIIPLPGKVDPPRLAEFLSQARALEHLHHPGIAGLLDGGEFGGRLYFAMEYVQGQDVGRLVREQGPLPVPRAVHFLSQVLEALAHAHERHFIHRNIKPSNLLVTEEEVARLTDFGLARLYDASPLSGLPMTGRPGGSAAFLPPEQIAHYHVAAPTVDQYGAAATLYYLLTGSSPYELRGELPQQAAQVLNQLPIPLLSRRPDLPGALAAVIHKALARQPERRFADVAGFRQALLQAANAPIEAKANFS